MESCDRDIKKIHRLCYKLLKKRCSGKVGSRLLWQFADLLPTTLMELSTIVPNFRRSRTDVNIILTTCKYAKLKKDRLYGPGLTLPDAQKLVESSTETESELDESTDEEPLISSGSQSLLA